MKLLFVTPTDLTKPRGGRAMLARQHRDQLADLAEGGLVECVLTPVSGGIVDQVRGYIDGADRRAIARVVAMADAHEVETLWLDGSNLGRVAQAVKRARPRLRIITFFHNVEARFFWGALRSRPGLRRAAVLTANYIAERFATRFSDTLVTLSERDSAGLRRLYSRGADAVAPIVLGDEAGDGSDIVPADADKYLLFVGGGFYANIAGIRWFAKNVAPRVELPTKIVGRGMGELAADLANVGNVELIGKVDDLAPWYAGATLAIAPIFDGSGMKTKVAEALMHGKRIAATPEALSGYADDVFASNWSCADADAFVAAIATASATPPPRFDPALRALYDRDHSPAAGAKRLACILAGSSGLNH